MVLASNAMNLNSSGSDQQDLNVSNQLSPTLSIDRPSNEYHIKIYFLFHCFY